MTINSEVSDVPEPDCKPEHIKNPIRVLQQIHELLNPPRFASVAASEPIEYKPEEICWDYVSRIKQLLHSERACEEYDYEIKQEWKLQRKLRKECAEWKKKFGDIEKKYKYLEETR